VDNATRASATGINAIWRSRTTCSSKVVPGDRGFLPGDSNPTGPGQGLDTFWPDGRGKKSRTQWQDHQNGAHVTKAGASCLTCHALHGDAVSKDPQQESKLRQPTKDLCESCHNQTGLSKQPNKEMYVGGGNIASSQHADQDVQCSDCHMGSVGQRMTKTSAGPAAFDVSFHGTSIVLPVPSNQPFPLFETRGNCDVCHTDQWVMSNGTKPPKKTHQELIEYVRRIQEWTKSSVTQIQSRGGTNRSKDPKTVLQLSNAQANLNMILVDGSMGFHNSRVSLNGNVSPQGGFADCLRLANLWVELACRQSGANCTGTPFNPITGPITEPNAPVCLSGP